MRYRELAVEHRYQDPGRHRAQKQGRGQVHQLERDNEGER
jgi:hypothetical protein